MVQLSYLGPIASVGTDLARKAYLDGIKGSGFLDQEEVDSLISEALEPYADKSYVDLRDSSKTTVAAVDAVDNTKIKVATINTSGGPVGLDAAGRVPVARVPGTSTQRFPAGPYTPLAFLGSTVASTSGNEVTLMTATVTDPGFDYRLLISGQVDCHTNVTGDPPVVRVRAGSASGVVLATGLGSTRQYRWGVDTFDRTASNLGPNWEQSYSNPGAGEMGTNGTSAAWVPGSGGPENIGFFRRVNSFFASDDDYQDVYTKVDSPPGTPGLFGGEPFLRIYGRVNSGRTAYVAWELTNSTASLIYRNGNSEGVLVGPVDWEWQSGDEIVAQFGHFPTATKRRYRLIRNGTTVIDFYETNVLSVISSSHRGWGFGAKAPSTLLFGQVNPPSLQWIAFNDPAAPWSADPENYSPVTLMPTVNATLTGSTDLYVTLRAQSTSTVYASSFLPNLHVMAIPA